MPFSGGRKESRVGREEVAVVQEVANAARRSGRSVVVAMVGCESAGVCHKIARYSVESSRLGTDVSQSQRRSSCRPTQNGRNERMHITFHHCFQASFSSAHFSVNMLSRIP